MEVSVIDDPPMIDATKCTSAQLRGVGTFLTHGGLIIAQGDNQYIGHPIVLRQLDAKQKQGAKNGVFLAAVCHPEPQNGTFPAAGNEAEWLYRRRLSASHRSPPPQILFLGITGRWPILRGIFLLNAPLALLQCFRSVLGGYLSTII